MWVDFFHFRKSPDQRKLEKFWIHLNDGNKFWELSGLRRVSLFVQYREGGTDRATINVGNYLSVPGFTVVIGNGSMRYKANRSVRT